MSNKTVDAESATEAFAAMAREAAYFDSAPKEFLSAWKQGVVLSGPQLFGMGTRADVEGATTKWDLRPNMEFISQAIRPMTPAEKVFLAALTSFYNAEDGGHLLRRVGFNGFADLGRLDYRRRAVIGALILNYTGW